MLTGDASRSPVPQHDFGLRFAFTIPGGEIMHFTHVDKIGIGVLTIATIAWVGHDLPAPIAPAQNTIAVERPVAVTPQSPTTLSFDSVGAMNMPVASGYSYQPISSWYKNKHWWKRNGPIVGGAGGGALIGGLAGGGTGALIGGAIGGGGGYLYKRHESHHRKYHHGYGYH
jgi:hypothetical protein